jgi:hypothetical protein
MKVGVKEVWRREGMKDEKKRKEERKGLNAII